MAAPIHLHPTTELAPRVLLPGDPGRALHLAQELLEAPLMFNHNRGLWGYTGTAADGEPLTIQSTGMGAPSAAIVAHELLKLGACHADRPHSRWLLVPGLVVRKLTTPEPDDRRLEAALAALIRVLAAGGRVAPEAPRLGAARRIDAGAPPLVPAAPLPNAAE